MKTNPKLAEQYKRDGVLIKITEDEKSKIVFMKEPLSTLHPQDWTLTFSDQSISFYKEELKTVIEVLTAAWDAEESKK